ncbi:MAG: hypothetical protein RR358_06000 [Cetobacterium sp.]
MKTIVKRVYEMEMSGEEFDLIKKTLEKTIGDHLFEISKVQKNQYTVTTNGRLVKLLQKSLDRAIESYQLFTGETYNTESDINRIEAIFDIGAERGSRARFY